MRRLTENEKRELMEIDARLEKAMLMEKDAKIKSEIEQLRQWKPKIDELIVKRKEILHRGKAV